VDIARDFGTSPTKELDGVWFPLDLEGESRIKLRRFNNPKYRDYIRKVTMNNPVYRRMLRGVQDDATQDAVDRVTLDALVKTIIVEWDGILEDGVPVPYNEDQAHRLCTTYPEFRDFVSEACQNLAAFQDVATEEMEGNLPSSSSGKTTTVSEKTGSKN
jgi:hypothetical protein